MYAIVSYPITIDIDDIDIDFKRLDDEKYRSDIQKQIKEKNPAFPHSTTS
jgi:formiminotetrahydrofolate cyclodeaminase